MKIVETERGVTVSFHVKPRSRKFKVVVENGEIVVHCREKPVKGKVNKELVKEFSRLFHKRVELISGFTSKQKVLLIRDADRKEVEKHLFS
ncbi:YggU family protein [Candidatus Bathyarchaeota archaeon]|nr:MAG: YggU family protein [Candidatus Bathyarchaeota archaeon]